MPVGQHVANSLTNGVCPDAGRAPPAPRSIGVARMEDGAARAWRLLAASIDARAYWAKNCIDDEACRIRKALGDEVRYAGLRHRAITLVEDLGAEHHDASCPSLLADIEPLARAFRESQARAREDAAILASLEERGLPAPQTLLSELLASGTACVNCTGLTWEEELNVTWYTNAYGIDGLLCGRPDLKAMQSFLIDVARGVEYGPVP